MSLPEMPVSVFAVPQTPEVPPTPEALFATHVAQVRGTEWTTGRDSLDMRRNFWRLPIGGIAMAASGVAALSYAPEHGARGVVVPVVVAGITTLSAYNHRLLRNGRHKRAAVGRLDCASQIQNDMHYELFAIGPRKPDDGLTVAMRWYGANDSEDVGIEQLERAANLAYGHGIDQFIVSERQATDRLTGQLPGATTTMQDWLKNNKHLFTEGDAVVEPVQVASPKEWLECMAGKQAARTGPQAVRMGYVGVLEANHAGLRAVMAKEQYGAPTEPGKLFDQRSDRHDGPSRDVPFEKLPVFDANQYSGVQEMLAVGVPSPKARISKRQVYEKIAFATAGVAAGAALGVLQTLADSGYRIAETQARIDIARAHQANPDTANIDPAAIRRKVDEDSLYRLWRPWYDVRQAVNTHVIDWLQGDIGSSASDLGNDTVTGFDAARGGVGNIGSDSHTPIWSVEGHNMQTSGSWTMATAEELHLSGPEKMKPAEMSWGLASTYTYNPIAIDMLPTSFITDENGSWIKVQRTIDKSDSARVNGDSYTPLPVLKGTVPMALAVDGEAAQLWKGKNGTYAVYTPNTADAPESTVTYWLQKGQAQPVRAMWEGSIVMSDNTDIKQDGDVIEKVLDGYLPGYLQATPDERTAMLVDYMHHNFGYSLNPLPKNFFYHMDELSDFVVASMKAKKAVCNTAATLTFLQDRQWNAELTFENGGDTAVLSADEAHMKLVNQEGKEIDPTPPGQIPLSSPGNHPPAPLVPLLLAPQLLAIGAYSYARRRRLAYVSHQLHDRLSAWRADCADYSLRHPRNHAALRLAATAALQAYWHEDGVQGASELTKQAAKITPNDAYRTLIDPIISSPDLLQHLQAQPQVTRPALRAVRRARRALRRPTS